MTKPLARQLKGVLVFAAAALLVLLLAFFTRGFSESVGDARVVGRYAALPLFGARALTQLSVTWNGLTLRFSPASSPALTGYQTVSAGIDIILAGDARLRVTSGQDAGGSLSIIAVLPTSAGSGAASAAGAPIQIPFLLAGAPALSDGGSALSWTRDGRSYLLSLPKGARADLGTHLLTLPQDAAAGVLRLETKGIEAVAAKAEVSPRIASKQAKLPDEKAMPTIEQVQTASRGFADAAWAGWSQSRLVAASTFSEAIGIGLCAESIARGAWQQIFPLWTDALARQAARDPSVPAATATSPYAGNIRDWARARGAKAAAETARVRDQMARSDPAALSTPGTAALIISRGDAPLVQALTAYLARADALASDTSSALGLLEAILDAGSFAAAAKPEDAAGLARAARQVIDRTLLAAVRATDAGVFLESRTAGRSDLGESLRCGALLMRAGQALSYPLAAAIGRGLLLAPLALAGDAGFLPATVSIASGRVSGPEGSLAPEAVYALLPLDRRVPHEIPLARQLGQGAWLWTAAALISVEGTASEARLVLSYPAGIPHHLAIGGVGPFTQVKLHGIAWRTDPMYSKYSDGWAYDAVTQTLFIKLTGRADQEEIDIRY
jgi:hypothetical protein